MPRTDEEPAGIFGIYARFLRRSRLGRPGGGESAASLGCPDPARPAEGPPRAPDEDVQVPEPEFGPCGKPFSFPVV